MRPNIDISHTLSGRVKDLAEAQDEETTLQEMYVQVIERGVEELESEVEE